MPADSASDRPHDCPCCRCEWIDLGPVPNHVTPDPNAGVFFGDSMSWGAGEPVYCINGVQWTPPKGFESISLKDGRIRGIATQAAGA